MKFSRTLNGITLTHQIQCEFRGATFTEISVEVPHTPEQKHARILIQWSLPRGSLQRPEYRRGMADLRADLYWDEIFTEALTEEFVKMGFNPNDLTDLTTGMPSDNTLHTLEYFSWNLGDRILALTGH